MQKTLAPAERLIVAADFKPTVPSGREQIQAQVLALARRLRGTGVYLKVNSALRACGYELIGLIQSYGLKVFADLKLFDIGETLSTDGMLLKAAKPELLTTVCVAGINAMRALKAELPDTEVLGVTVLTSFTEGETLEIFWTSVEGSVVKLARLADTAGIDGLICAPTDIAFIKAGINRPMSFNTPAIRPTWAIVPGDDQNPDRIMTPAKAIMAGADRIVIGRPIVRSDNPYDAVMRTIEEIASATT
jgi:orotidine-5'-phosphate decarboxylase